MTAFRLLLIVQFALLTVYTIVTVAIDGWNLFPDYFGVLREMRWPGQFTADFTVFLILTGVWVAWRGHFSARSIARGLLASALGTGFIAPYLLYLSYRERGDVVRMLIGDRIGSAH